MTFTQETTEGYTQGELDALNVEMSQRLGGLEVGSDEYSDAAKKFHDEVAGR